MKILLLICTGLLAIIPITVIINSYRKKEKFKKSDIIISTLGIIAFILTQFIENQQERKAEAQQQIYNLEIAKINQTISEERHNTEIARQERDSILAEIEKTKLQTKLAEIKIENLKIKSLQLEQQKDSLFTIAYYEKTSRYIIEAKTVENRKIYQFGPIISELGQFKDLNILISTIDNGEAINTRDRLITLLVNMIGLQVVKSDLFYDSEFDYLIDPKNRKETIPYFDEGITVLYFDLFLENKNLTDPFKKSISELAAKILVKHLLAMGVYADYTPSNFINKSLKENEIYIYIGKKYENEDEKVLSLITHDEEIKALKNYMIIALAPKILSI